MNQEANTLPLDAPFPLVLRAAAEIIEQRGATGGTRLDPDTGRVCAVGAICQVYAGSPEIPLLEESPTTFADPYRLPVVVAAGEILAAPASELYRWNDDIFIANIDEPEEVTKLVAAGLREAADKLEVQP